jgi:lactate dehydrogenase-like 2-hydroxyacid dehydrogenase
LYPERLQIQRRILILELQNINMSNAQRKGQKMSKVKVAINGYGTIGKRVADAVNLQDDMEVIGISKTRPNFETQLAHQKGYPVYTLTDKADAMKKAGIPRGWKH